MAPKPPAPPSPSNTAETGVDVPQTSAFTFDDVPMPEKLPGRSGGPRELSDVRKKLAAVPVGKSWLETVEVPSTIIDPKEQASALKEAAKTVQNRIQGDIRRHKKAEGNSAHNFSVIFVNDAERGTGVRIYRRPDTSATPSVEQPAAV